MSKKIIPRDIARQLLLQAKKLEALFRKNETENCFYCQEASNIEIDFENVPRTYNKRVKLFKNKRTK